MTRIGRTQGIAGLLLLRQHKPQRMDLGKLHLTTFILLQEEEEEREFSFTLSLEATMYSRPPEGEP